jgi:hypothetical protein
LQDSGNRGSAEYRGKQRQKSRNWCKWWWISRKYGKLGEKMGKSGKYPYIKEYVQPGEKIEK